MTERTSDTAENQRMPSLAVVVPVFNEGQALRQFNDQLMAVLNELPNQARVYFVNDGSSDNTAEVLDDLRDKDDRVVVISLSRNFGHQAAISAGLDVIREQVVITMDADGQHPPSLIPEMLELHTMGYDVVLTQRTREGQSSFLKRWSSVAFYRLLNRISDTELVPRAADFRLLSAKVVQALRGMREYHRFLRGMIAWMGFKTVIIPYSPAERLAGESKYSLAKMLRLAADAAFSFSLVPLYLGVLLSGLFLLLALAEVAYVLSFWISGAEETLEPGWSSLMFMILIVGATISAVLGIIGVYVGYVFQEVKRRPVYIISEVSGLDTGADQLPGSDR